MMGVELRIWDIMMSESSLGYVFVSIQTSDKNLSNLFLFVCLPVCLISKLIQSDITSRNT